MASDSNDLQMDKLVEVAIVKNTGTIVIWITRDKVEIALRNFKEAMNKRTSILAPISLLVSVIATLLNADFKNYIIAKEVWNAIYLLVAISSIIWLIYSIYGAIKYKGKTEIEFVLKQLIKEEEK